MAPASLTRATGGRTAAEANLALDEDFVAHAQLALLAAKQGAWDEAGRRARAAQALLDQAGLRAHPGGAGVHGATGRGGVREARPEEARSALARTHRLRPLLGYAQPWLT